MVRVLLFGRLADQAGWRERIFEVPAPARLSALKGLIAELDGALGAALEGPSVRAAVDKLVVNGDADLHPGAEIAFMPPMSGG